MRISNILLISFFLHNLSIEAAVSVRDEDVLRELVANQLVIQRYFDKWRTKVVVKKISNLGLKRPLDRIVSDLLFTTVPVLKILADEDFLVRMLFVVRDLCKDSKVDYDQVNREDLVKRLCSYVRAPLETVRSLNNIKTGSHVLLNYQDVTENRGLLKKGIHLYLDVEPSDKGAPDFDCLMIPPELSSFHVRVKEGVLFIDTYCFWSCETLNSVRIARSVLRVMEGEFSNCKLLQFVDIPPNVQMIDSRAFSHCRSLEKLFIPGGLQTVGVEIFEGWFSLKVVYISKNMTPVIKEQIRAMVSEANKHALVIEVDEGRNFAELEGKVLEESANIVVIRHTATAEEREALRRQRSVFGKKT